MMEKTARQIIGLDIGKTWLKAVKVTSYADRSEVEDMALKQVSAGDDNEKISVYIKELVQKLDPQAAAQIHMIVSGPEIAFRHSVVPFMPKDELKDAVRWSLKESASFDIDKSAIDFDIIKTLTGTDGIKRHEVFAIAVSENAINKHVKLLQQAGLNPAFMTTAYAGAYNFLSLDEAFSRQKTVAFIDISLDATTILIFESGKLEFIRKISSNSNSFVDALSGVSISYPKNIDLTRDMAGRIIADCGIPVSPSPEDLYEGIPLSQIQVLLRPVLERFLADIRNSIQFYKEEFQAQGIDLIVISGPGAVIKNIKEHISNGLGGIAVDLVRPAAKLSVKGQEKAQLPLFVSAIGACLVKEQSVNLLPASVKIQKTIGFQQMVLRISAIVFSILMVFGIIYMSKQKQSYQKMLSVYDNYYANLYKLRLDRDKITKREKFFAEIIGREKNLFVYLKALTRVVPLPVEFKSLEFIKEDGLFSIEGVVYSSSASSAEKTLSSFLLALEGSPYFLNPQLLSSERSFEGEFEKIFFSLSLGLNQIK